MKRFIKLLLPILLAISLSSCVSAKSINLNGYVETATSGTDGTGKMAYKINWKGIDDLIGQQQILSALKKINPSAHTELINSGVQVSCADLIVIYPDRSEGLSNGDKVGFIIEPGNLAANATLDEIEKALNVNLSTSQIEIKDLPEALVIDVFKAFDEDSVKFYCTVPGDTSSIKGIVDINITDENRIIYEGNGYVVQYEDEISSLDPMFSVSKDGQVLGYFSFCGTHYFMTGYKEGDLWPVYITQEDASILGGYGFSLARTQMDYVVKDIADSE